MKVLFQNYTNDLSTEPLYLYNAMRQCGVDVELWSDPKLSTFDAFDSYQPEVFVAHYQTLTSDIVKYLTNSNIELVLNVTGASNDQLKDIEGSLPNIDKPFMFTNSFGLQERIGVTTKFHKIYPAFDLFNMAGPAGVPSGLTGVITRGFSDHTQAAIDKYNLTTYHKLQMTDGKIDEHCDVRVNTISAPKFVRHYTDFILEGDYDFCCSQILLDLAIREMPTKVHCTEQDKFNASLDEIFHEPMTKDGSDNIRLGMKLQLKSKHTPFHRAATLMKHLKCEESSKKIEKVKAQLPEALQDL